MKFMFIMRPNDTVFSVEPFELATWAGKSDLFVCQLDVTLFQWVLHHLLDGLMGLNYKF